MSDPLTKGAILAAAGKAFAQVAPLAIGAAIALKFNTSALTLRARVFAVFASFALGHYIGGAIIEWYAIDSGFIADAIKVAAALYGMSAVTSISAEIPAVIASIRRRITGESQ